MGNSEQILKPMMNNLQFLILEDRVTDYELAIRELRKRGLEFAARRVDNEPDFRRQIEGFRPDVILADQSLPGYSGMSALAVARQECPAVPFIFLSGTLGEEQAVECLKLGATDYVLKQRLERLVPAVKRALREAEDRRARLQVEAEFRASEEQFRAMFEVASIGMGQADPRTGQLLRVNQKMCAITGYSAAELLGMRVSELTHPDDRQQDWEKFERVVRGEVSDYRLEKRYLRKDGSVAWVNVNMTVIRDAVGQPTRTMATIEDITERKRTEESHARLATAVEQAAETIVITDTQGAILYANPAFEKTSGYTRAEALGQNPRILKSGKHAAEFYRQIWTVLNRGEVWSGRFINQKKDGTLYEEEATISPVRDLAGKIVNYVAVKRDVTREAQLEAQLRQSQKMEAVGQLAGGVAHDFNNLLAVIRGSAELMLMDDEQHTSATRAGLNEVVAAAARAANLTRQLLAFSRKQELQPQPVVLNEIIANLARLLQRVMGQNISLQCHYATPLPYVQADTGMMEQVILNLVVNARDAMPKGGQIRLVTKLQTLDAAHARVNPEARAGEFVCLSVSDTGTGIDPEVLPRIFEPFFTTKEVGRGTGLGLATVYGIVKQHLGWIEVSSQVGQGSTFKVFLPAIPTPARLPVAPNRAEVVSGGQETILLVEEDSAVRIATRRLLESKGYTVREAMGAQAALDQCHTHAGEIALLLTDIIMRGEVSGRDLADRLWRQRPGLRVIFMSGYSGDVVAKDTEFTQRTRSRFLQKPCPARILLETVRQCLDE